LGLEARLVRADPNRGLKPELSMTKRFLRSLRRKNTVKTLAIFATTLATPVLAHPAGAAGHLPHWAYLAAVISFGVALAVRNAIKG